MSEGASRPFGQYKSVWCVDDSFLPLQLARGQFDRHRGGTPFIEHIDAPESVITEAHRVLRRGGQILLTTPRRQGATAAHEHHCHEYTAAELADLLRRRFSNIHIRVFQPIGASRLYHRRVFGRKLFRIAINCCAIAGWNPLAKTGDVSDETRHTDLCASGQKA